jgi:predicted outer membrane repeat protein
VVLAQLQIMGCTTGAVLLQQQLQGDSLRDPLHIVNSAFVGNSGAQSAIWMTSAGALELDGVTFLQNSASKGGAVVAVTTAGSSVTMRAVAFTNNTGNGSCITVAGLSVLSISNGTFANNRGGPGAAVWLAPNSSANLTEARFTSNTAKGAGGALMVSSGASCNITRGNFTGNVATTGGAVSADKFACLKVRRVIWQHVLLQQCWRLPLPHPCLANSDGAFHCRIPALPTVMAPSTAATLPCQQCWRLPLPQLCLANSDGAFYCRTPALPTVMAPSTAATLPCQQ